MARVRLEVWDPEGTRQLRTRRGLPAVELPGGLDAPLTDLRQAVRSQLRIDVALLRLTDDGAAEVECLDPSAPLAGGLRWGAERLSPPLEERVPWERPGWLDQAVRTVDQALSGLGLGRTGPPTQERHWLLAAILRVPTTGGDVWFKAVPPLCRHEGPVTEWLGQLAPAAVPTVLASGPGWWVAAEFPAEADDPKGHPLEELARIQVAATSRTDELRRRGCPDRGLGQLVEDVRALGGRRDLLTPATAARLRDRLGPFAELCAEVDGLGIPSSLVHGDLNVDNVRWTDQGWFLYDWSDACVAHPFVDVDGWADDQHGFAEVWAEAVPERSVRRTLAAATAIWAAHRAVSYQRLVDAFHRSATEGGIPKLHRSVVRLLDAL